MRHDGPRHDGRRHDGHGGMNGRRHDGRRERDAGNFWRSEEKKVMIRAFDFTVREDASYRYRVRIVVHNPNFGREDVNHDVNTKAEELRGPWSEADRRGVHAAGCHALCQGVVPLLPSAT